METGDRFSRLVVVVEVGQDKWTNRLYLCDCDCGKTHIAAGWLLRRGDVQSCGCLKHDAPKNKTHGARHTRAFYSWWNMKSRCERSNSRYYADYGGRGIAICERWRDFTNFLADMGQPPEGYTLEREDNNGDYEPGNVKWSDRKVQANNRRSNVVYTVDGVTRTLQQWADEVGLGRSTITARIKAGWPPDVAIKTPKLK